MPCYWSRPIAVRARVAPVRILLAFLLCRAGAGAEEPSRLEATPDGAADAPIVLQPTGETGARTVVIGARRDPNYTGPEPGVLPEFTLTDQLGRTVTKETLLGRPWVANFIFSSCPTHCPVTLNELFHLQRRLKDIDAKFVTITVDPQTDTVAKLKELSEAYGADPERWLFLTGEPAEIQQLITKGFLQPMESSPMALAHSLKLMQVNPEGRVVGSYLYDFRLPQDSSSEIDKLRKVLLGEIEIPPSNRFLPAIALEATGSQPESGVSSTREPAAKTDASADASEMTPAWVDRLRTTNATLNGLATILLLVGFTAMRVKNIALHKRLMLTAFAVSIAFLACYLTYHGALKHYTGVGHKPYAGTPSLETPYRVILISHVILAAIVPVLASITIYRGLSGQFDRHRRIARVTFPIWLYVSVTGVIIYWMNAG